jgi:CelD/BcsL family acetyltransferase involved in cellulose biosynthesis
MHIELIPHGDLPKIQQVWTALAAQGPVPYFLSWGWVKTWLDCLPTGTRLRLAVVHRQGVPVAAFFLGSRRLLRHRFVPSRALYLNQTGHAEHDEICIEYNSWVPPRADLRLEELLDLLPGGWDELFLRALDGDSEPGRRLGEPLAKYRVLCEERITSPWVSLDKVRAAGDYLTLLSANARAQIRRTQRIYADRGQLVLDVPATVEEALRRFAELVNLHERAWLERGKPGAFIPWVRNFHERLIRQRFDTGEIQLLRLRAGEQTIGCLYNFVWQGAVDFYQSGMVYEEDGRLKPGLLCHAEAIRHNAALGHRIYDLLAGDSRYKQTLATDEHTLLYARVQRHRWRFRLEDELRRARDRARELKRRLIALREPRTKAQESV